MLVDADYVDKVAFNLIVNFERMLGRRIPKADLAKWVDCVALDGGLRAGGHETLVVLAHQKSKAQLDNFAPGNYAAELDGKAFKDSLGEFVISAVPIEPIADSEDYLTEALRLVTARLHGEDVGTFLLAPGDQTMGIYYFAVLPEFRRQGVAAEMMSEAGRMALAAGCHELVLQSTPAGLPFYRNAGFTPRGEMALFSSSEDVF